MDIENHKNHLNPKQFLESMANFIFDDDGSRMQWGTLLKYHYEVMPLMPNIPNKYQKYLLSFLLNITGGEATLIADNSNTLKSIIINIPEKKDKKFELKYIPSNDNWEMKKNRKKLSPEELGDILIRLMASE